jgi:hypothetical protein
MARFTRRKDSKDKEREKKANRPLFKRKKVLSALLRRVLSMWTIKTSSS